MVGIAARSGIALGLNIRRTNNIFDAEATEARKRLWWSIFYLEHLLSAMTGRASCLGDGSCSAPPPLPFEHSEYEFSDVGQWGDGRLAHAGDMQWTIFQSDEQIEAQHTSLKSMQPSASLYFFYLVDLAFITHSITNREHSTSIFRDGWIQIESRIEIYTQKLDQWVSGLHASLAFEDKHGNQHPRSRSYYQVSLALHYYSARVVLNRHCLTRPETAGKSGINLPRSQFYDKTSSAFLRASLALIAVLPDQPDTVWAYNVAPWWGFLHFLMQATIACLIHFSVLSVPASVETEEGAPGSVETPEVVLAATKKALHWLYCLGKSDEAARRAFLLCNNCIRRIASSKGLDLSGMPSTIDLSETSSVAQSTESDIPREISNSRLQQDQGSESMASQGVLDDEGKEDTLFQESEEPRKSRDIVRSLSAVLDTDIAMSEWISDPTDANFEELLLVMIGPNV